MSSTQSQGWHEQQSEQSDFSPQKIHFKSLKLQLNNLISQSYPIEPDMILGWRPKLPSGPVPLAYLNLRSEYILYKFKNSQITQNSKYKLIYFGNRYINSVKVNQQYNYSWKQRNKYKLNLRLLKQAIEFVGNNFNFVEPKVSKCEYIFDSNFESGNLDFVVQSLEQLNYFDCFIKSDTNTKGHCNWYYFSVTNSDKITKYNNKITLNISNLTKNAELYKKGMKPYIKRQNSYWKQYEGNIYYQQKLCKYGYGGRNYELQFQLEFENPNQIIYVSYGIPYTYSTMEAFVKTISNQYPDLVTNQNLCQSLGGIPIPILSITNDSVNTSNKQIILITSRIHPGQSVSSFVIEGFIKNLLENESYKFLLQKFIFKIIPMLNPDGVIIGNFRTSYSGKDLNRQFNKPNKYIFPQIYFLIKYTKKLKNEYDNKFLYYFDLHGHTTKTNLFCYGPEHGKNNSYFLKSRVFAKLIEQEDKIFQYKKSLFTINPSKKNTGRALMLKKLKIPMSFTFELSNGLFDVNHTIHKLNQAEMNRAGVSILKGFFRYIVFMNQVKIRNINGNGYQNLKKIKKHTRIKTKNNASKQKKVLSVANQKMAYSTQKLNNNRKSSISKKLAFDQYQKIRDKDKQREKEKDKLQRDKDIPVELQNLYRNILRQQNEIKEVIQQGGSDSENESEDLNQVQTDMLFKSICRREINQKSSSNPLIKLKEVKVSKQLKEPKQLRQLRLPKHSLKSQKSQKQTSVKQEEEKEKHKQPLLNIIKKSKSIMRSETARLRRPTMPVPHLPPPPPPVLKQVLIQRHFILDI